LLPTIFLGSPLSVAQLYQSYKVKFTSKGEDAFKLTKKFGKVKLENDIVLDEESEQEVAPGFIKNALVTKTSPIAYKTMLTNIKTGNKEEYEMIFDDDKLTLVSWTHCTELWSWVI